jgi:DNA-binding Xre family transcriptional regulator
MFKETKLKKYLRENDISQTELFNKIQEKCIFSLGSDVISKIVSGKKNNYEINTLLKICIALNLTPNDIIEKDLFIEKHIKK